MERRELAELQSDFVRLWGGEYGSTALSSAVLVICRMPHSVSFSQSVLQTCCQEIYFRLQLSSGWTGHTIVSSILSSNYQQERSDCLTRRKLHSDLDEYSWCVVNGQKRVSGKVSLVDQITSIQSQRCLVDQITFFQSQRCLVDLIQTCGSCIM